MPFYVSPEQLMLDRAEFARKGIARGRSVAVLKAADGLLFIAENHSSTLRKVSEIYDRIGFAAVGRYHEFESLRVAGIRHADMRGYSYARSDVTGRSLAGAYSQLLGASFAAGGDKPFEVELIVGELGEESADDVLFRINYDGVVTDEDRFAVIGGDAERIAGVIGSSWHPELSLDEAARLTASAFNQSGALRAESLEVALLDWRSTRRRRFRRIEDDQLNAWLDG